MESRLVRLGHVRDMTDGVVGGEDGQAEDLTVATRQGRGQIRRGQCNSLMGAILDGSQCQNISIYGEWMIVPCFLLPLDSS